MAQTVKNLPARQETWVRSLGVEDSLEESMATHSSILVWRIPMDSGAWQSAVHGVTKNRTWLSDQKCMHWWLRLSGKESGSQCRRYRFDPWIQKIAWRRKWQPTPVLLPRQFHGQRSLVGYSPWGRQEFDTMEHWAQPIIWINVEKHERCPFLRCEWFPNVATSVSCLFLCNHVNW